MALEEINDVRATANASQNDATGDKDKLKVVDADAHCDAPYEMWAEYLPASQRDKAPKIIHGEEYDEIEFEGNRRPVMMISNQAGRKGENFKMKGRRDEMRPVWKPEIRLQDMDDDGMDAAVMFGGGPLGTFDEELYLASFDAYSRWIWDYCSTDSKRLVPVGYIPTRTPEESMKMMKELADMGFRSVNIPAFPQNWDSTQTSAKVKALKSSQIAALTGDPSAGRSYADPEWDPFWAMAQDLDMTITQHLGGRVPRFGEKKYFLADMPMSKTAMIEPIAILIFNGIFQKYPKLRFVVAESGVGWFAWLTEYMDRTWEKQRFWTESCLKEPPSHFMDQNVFGSFIQDRTGILNRNLPGGKNIMWSSDYPHSETTWPNSHAIIKRDFAGIPQEDVHDIVCARAAKVYSVEI